MLPLAIDDQIVKFVLLQSMSSSTNVGIICVHMLVDHVTITWNNGIFIKFCFLLGF